MIKKLLLKIIKYQLVVTYKGWKSATITPLLMEGKNSKVVRSYRLVALANIHCKIFERMTSVSPLCFHKKKTGLVPEEREK